MELQFYGANCVRIVTKKATIVIDDNLSGLGLKPVVKPGDMLLSTVKANTTATEAKLVVDEPGEYEALNVALQGVAARAHMDEEGTLNATMFRIDTEDIRIAIVGHIYPDLTEEQLEALGTVDVLIVPVGGGGYTLDSVGALKVIKAIEPKIVIPTHYADKAVNYEVPQQSLDEALKGLAMEPVETTAKLKLKSTDLPEMTQLIVLERQ